MSEETDVAGGSGKPSWAAETVILFAAADMSVSMLVQGTWASIAVRAGLAAVFIAASITIYGAKPTRFGFARGSARRGIVAVAVSTAAGAALLGAAWALYAVLRGPAALPAPPPPSDWSAGLPLEWIGLSLIAYPLLEEIVYRGILYKPIEDRAGRVGAILASGLVFQALHAAYGIWMPHYFFGGMILAWAFARSGSLLYPLVLHSGWNAFVMFADFARWQGWIRL